MIDVALAFWDVFWKVALALAVFEGARYIYKHKLKGNVKDMLISFTIYFAFLAAVAAFLCFINKGAPDNKRDLLEPRNLAAEKKFDVCWEHRPDAEDRESREFISFQADYKRLGCPEFMLYLDECEADCHQKAVAIIRRSFYSNAE
ncbi:MAG: hypothetical protein J6M62_10295 [Selenomonadaceae bacterium]|nr:hypothetical protein [Selenomonadaceae bacterium]